MSEKVNISSWTVEIEKEEDRVNGNAYNSKL